MRYLVHLLPAEEQLRAFDALRARIAACIGYNKALEYPTAHITLVWSIQDDPDDTCPIDRGDLIECLERWRNTGVVTLQPGALGSDDKHHLLLPLGELPELSTLRHALANDLRAACDLGGRHSTRAGRVREQTWPHLTLAQDIDPDRWDEGSVIARKEQLLITSPIAGTHLALLARDIDRNEPYRIVHRMPLVQGEH